MPKVKKSVKAEESKATTPPNGEAQQGEATQALAKPVKQKGKAKASGHLKTVKYPTVSARLHYGSDSLTVGDAKDIIGWEEVKDEDPSCWPELKSLLGLNVRLNNNPSNRWLTPGWLIELKQDHLNRRWRFNGESMVIGEYGDVLSGQHRLLSFILAEYERTGHASSKAMAEKAAERAQHWKEQWGDTPLTMDTVVVYGVKEDDQTFQTLNCGKKSSLAEVLYRSTYFQKSAPAARKELSKALDWAVKLLWDRTGLKDDVYAPTRTHGEAMDFIAHHQRLPEFVSTIAKEYGDKAKASVPETKDGAGNIIPKEEARALWQILTPGNAAAVFYLMATSSSDGAAYWNADPREEGSGKKALLNFDMEEKALEFWTGLNLRSGPRKEYFDPVRIAIGRLADPDTKRGGTLQEKLYVLASAWHYFLEDEEFTAQDLEPKYTPLDPKTGRQKLKDVPTFGGIDQGIKDEPEEVKPAEKASKARAAVLATAEERAKTREELLARRAARKAGEAASEGESATLSEEEEQALEPDGVAEEALADEVAMSEEGAG